MCGITGFAGDGDDACLDRMTDALTHRGPDERGVYRDGRLALGHRRLSILDLAQGQQPMTTVDGRLTVVYNGEIYNHRELRADLEAHGHVFRTDHSDTEVLLHGWREWGTHLPERLNGMWAFAVYDRDEKLLFLSRDRFGQKPLFYHHHGDTFVFGSELDALGAHPAVPRAIDPVSVQKYFAYGFIPAPRSILRNVCKLPAGHNALYRLRESTLTVQRYWQFRPEPADTLPPGGEAEWCEELRHHLRNAVRRRLMADVPLGILLSGGIDSSAVAAMASGDRETVHTFSIGFQERSYDESPHAARVARHLGTDHTLSMLSQEDVRAHGLSVLDRMDEPMADDSLLPTYLVCREARKRVTVALGGDGGDELFAGYEPFGVLHWARRCRDYLPRPVHAALEALIGCLPASPRYMSLEFKCKRFFHGALCRDALWIPVWMSPLFPEDVAELLAEPVDPESLYEEAIQAWEGCPSPDPIDRATQYYIDLYLQEEILVKGDRASMMNGLELRCPFLDIDVVNFARKIPAAYRLRGGTGKYLLKKALEPLLPRDILYRSKQGFSPPTGHWFRDGSLAFEKTERTAAEATFLETALAAHRNGKRDHKLYFWAQLALDRFRMKHSGVGFPP